MYHERFAVTVGKRDAAINGMIGDGLIVDSSPCKNGSVAGDRFGDSV